MEKTSFFGEGERGEKETERLFLSVSFQQRTFRHGQNLIITFMDSEEVDALRIPSSSCSRGYS